MASNQQINEKDMDNDSSSPEYLDFGFDGKDENNTSDTDKINPEDPNGAWRMIEKDQVFLQPLKKMESSSMAQNEELPCTDTRFVLMSDTHSKHRFFRPPPGNVLLHAGDFTKAGEPGTIRDLNQYFGELKNSGIVEDVICIAGNHDITLDTDFYLHNWKSFPPYYNKHRGHKPYDEAEIQTYLQPDCCTYLCNSSCRTTTGNLEVYGSPISPVFGCWAFGMIRGPPIRRAWQDIPPTTDVLITHGPPLGRGDLTFYSGRVGCYDLMQEVQTRIRPRLHVFGHIHEDVGCTFDGYTLYVNAASVDLRYQPTHFCIVVDVPHDTTKPAVVVQPNCQITTPKQLQTWLETHQGYGTLLEHLREAERDVLSSELPLGNDLFGVKTHEIACSVLGLYRDDKARKDWQRACMEIYSESFPGR